MTQSNKREQVHFALTQTGPLNLGGADVSLRVKPNPKRNLLYISKQVIIKVNRYVIGN